MKWLYWYLGIALLTAGAITKGRLSWVSVAACLFWPVVWVIIFVAAFKIAVNETGRGESN